VGDVEVLASVIQFADGAIDRAGLIAAPLVHVEAYWESGLTLKQTRELAAALLEAADEFDGWTA
jgi:hypothetical protein